ncbi:MAG TPA: PAS domain S-box protein [Clostridia bacterium]|nr:PAS domain S-box protein [Clostridia bacterium]
MSLSKGDHSKPGRPLIGVLAGTFLVLAVLHAGMLFRWGTVTQLPHLPWVIPVTNALVMLAGLTVAFLSFGRYAVLRDTVSFWTGMAFAALATCQVFYVLAWPGLLPDDRAIIGNLPSTAAWVAMLTLSLPGMCLLAAVWARWPGQGALRKERWLWLVAGCLAGLVLANVAVVALEWALPTLVDASGKFTPLLRILQWSLTLLFGLGTIASARYYAKTGDTLPGYAALSQMFLFFFELAIVLGGKRYGQLFFADRFLVIGGFLAILVGLLWEHVKLFRRELERAKELEGSAEKLRKSEERYRTLFESIDEGFCTVEVVFDQEQNAVDYRFVEVNPAFERQTGLQDVVGRRMREIVPQHEEHWFKIYGHVALTGESTRFQNPAGKLGRHYDVYAFRIGAPAERKVAILFSDITEKVRVEQALLQERDFSAAVMDTAGALVVVLDRAGRICKFNRACVALTGYTEQEVIGRELWFLIPPEDLPGVQQEWATLNAGNTPTQHENNWVAKDGSRRLIAWSNAALTGANGEIEHIIATGLDISERKRTEQALKESQARMARAQTIAHLGSWELDILNNQLTWSDEVYRIFGFEPQSFRATYEAFLNAVHPEDRAAVDAAYSGSLREGKDSYEIEHRVVHAANGEVRIVHEKCEHLRDGSGRIVRSQGMVHDITERKRTEEALERSEARLAQGMQVAGLGIFEHDHRTDAIEFSSVMRQLLGFAEDEEVSIATIVQKVAPKDREFLAAMIRRAHEPTGDGHFEFDYRVPDGSGGVRWVSARSQTYFSGEGSERRAVRTIGAALDVTDRKEAQSRLERLVAERTAQLADANANLEQFAHTAAHDLRSPVRGIIGFASVVLKQYGQQLDGMGRSMLERIIGSATQMGQLLNDLLEYSKLTHTELRMETVSLEQVVRDALALQEAEIRTRQADVKVAAEMPAVIGHPATVVMVVANLVSNGLKFTTPGIKPQLRVWGEFRVEGNVPTALQSRHSRAEVARSEVEAAMCEAGSDSRSRWVRLWVEDNGIGIGAEDQAKVFEVFQRLHAKEAYPGTGLGLAIVRKAVERMGGRVGVESELGKGSRFWVELKGAD